MKQRTKSKIEVRARRLGLMFAELERCSRCHQRYPAPLGHSCPQASFAEQRSQELEQGFRSWLETSEGRFAEFLARHERSGDC